MITVQFKDFEEMRTFAKELLGINAGRAEEIGAPEGQPDQTPMQMQQAVPAVTEPAAPVQLKAPMQQPSQQLQPGQAPQVSRQSPITQMPQPGQTPQPIQPSQGQAVQPLQASVPTTTTGYTLDDLARAAMTLMDAGRQQELLGLLSQFGVDSLPALPQTQYGAFATTLRGMGAQI